MTEQDLFLTALDIADPAERAAYIAQACADNPDLRRQVESLLVAHDRSGEFLDVPALQQIAGRLFPSGRSAEPQSADADAETRAQRDATAAEIDLSFLKPAAKAGSIGRLGHYEVLEVIGRGACGVVMRAFDEKLCRVVAIKAMSLELAATSPARKRFLREARAAAAIRHDNVVSIYSVEEEPIPYLVMEHIDGRTLQQRLDQSGPFEIADVLVIGEQIARGLEAAHATGLIHRDIKPANILLETRPSEPVGGSPGVRVKISDFGLARAADDASLTQSGMIAGTPLYMSAEQARGDSIDARSDLFSLGSVLYVMCSGRPPFRASTTLAVLKRVAEDEPRPIQEIIPEVPAWLSAIIGKLHAKNPADRFATANEVAGLLGRCGAALRNGSEVTALPEIRTLLGGDAAPQSTQGAALGTLGAGASAEAGSVEATSAQPTGHSCEEEALSLQHPVASAPRVRAPRLGWAAAAAVLMAAIAGLSFTEASGVTNLRGTVVRLFSPEGTLVVEVDDPAVSVSIDGEEMVITGTGVKELRLKPGQYKVVASKDGKPVRQELVTVAKNGRQVVRVSREGEMTASAAPPAAPSEIEPSNSVDADRRAAEWVQSIGMPIEVRLRDNGKTFRLYPYMGIPPIPFELESVEMGMERVTDDGLRHFAGCTNLKKLSIGGAPVTDEGLAHFKDCTRLTSLNLQALKQVTDAGLRHFKECKDLISLNLTALALTDTGLAHFENCANLQELILHSDGQVTDGGLKHFGNCMGLKLLQLSRTPVTDAGLAHFKDCTNLTTLHLSDTRVTDAGMAHFRDCINLTTLHLSNTQVTDAGLVHFKGCSRLKTINLHGTQVTDAGLEWFKDCEDMEEVWLSSARGVTGAGLAYLDGHKSLRMLHLSSTPVKDSALEHIERCRALESLSISNTKISNNGVQSLSKLSGLRNLNVKGLPYLTKKGVEELKELLPRCRIEWDGGVIEPAKPAAVDSDRRAAEWVLSIGAQPTISVSDKRRTVSRAEELPSERFFLLDIQGLHYNQQVTDDGLANLRGCSRLQGISLIAGQATDAGMAHLRDLTQLKSLDLRDAARLTDAGLAHFKNCRDITNLCLQGPQITDAGIAHFKDCRQLQSLSLHGTQVTDKGLAHFRGCDLRTIGIGGPLITDAALAHLRESRNLANLWINGAAVTDEGLAFLVNCRNLESLDLQNTLVTDGVLPHLLPSRRLKQLDLRNTRVTDIGLDVIRDMASLSSLSIQGTKVTEPGVRMLAAARPDLRINWSGGVIEPTKGGAADPDRRAAE